MSSHGFCDELFRVYNKKLAARLCLGYVPVRSGWEGAARASADSCGTCLPTFLSFPDESSCLSHPCFSGSAVV